MNVLDVINILVQLSDCSMEEDYRAEIDPMNVPAKFRHLFYLECRVCHQEVDLYACTKEEKKAVHDGRICPACKVALAVEAIPQGKEGAWVPFFCWLDSQEGQAKEQITTWLDQALAKQSAGDGAGG